ncbi:MAG: META domain-containing protein [Chitinophagaceae bacterium]|nr:META domain-containing protein [Chitinophagaceae bacterium]
MKLFVPALFLLLLISSCKKQDPDTVLTGTWKLTEVIDRSTSSSQFPPTSASSYLSITFQSDGTYFGNTLVNTFSDGTYQIIDSSKVNFGSFSMTKINEDNFGRGLLTVLMSCGLQSVHPCVPSQYTITGRRLYIKSAMRYDLVLEKM